MSPKKAKRPALAIIVRGGVVQSVVSNRPDAFVPMIGDVVVIDYDYADGQVVIDRCGREDAALVYREPIQRSDVDVDEVVRELKRVEAEEGKRRSG